jgi:Ca-activated chloride channel family protein
VPYNNITSNYALNEISQLDAGGGTNISDALITAIGQFTATDPGAANIIIFFTDGEASAGITNTPGILQAVQDAVNFAETEIFLYTFGIGDYVNEQLLTLLAQQNSGASVFLGSDEVESVITDYFLQVNNPVLLNTEISFDPPIITDIYPNPLPNLYKGQQLILSGRYIEPVPVTVTLSGTAYNEPVMYQYSFTPVDTPVFEHQFLPKIWAKALIDQLTISFYSTIDVNMQEQLQNQIDSASICYGVVSNFTSFEDNGGGGSTANEQPEVAATSISAFPNPFWHITTVILQTDIPFGEVDLFMTDANGLIIRKIHETTDSYGLVRLTWDGKNDSGAIVPDGMYYVYTVINGMRHYLKIVKTE